MDSINISYRIKLNEKITEVFDFELDGTNFELITETPESLPPWTELAYNKCSHCPLNEAEHSHCPMAIELHKVIEKFHDTRSIDEVELEVITEERRVTQKTAIQRAISSMLGLVFPTCGCPKTAYMRPMARFHLPLATEEETVFRVTGTFLLAQYFLNEKGKKGQFDFSGLTRIYEDLHILNTAIAKRLKTATKSDSSKNAITLLDMYATLVPMLIEDQLVEIRPFFQAYLPEDEIEPVVSTHNYLERAKAFSMELELVPIENEAADDDVPDWMKEVRGESSGKEDAGDTSGQETDKPVIEEKDPLADRVFSFGLEEITEKDGKKPAASGKASFAIDEGDTPAPQKASFKLPDEPARPAAKKASFSLPGDEEEDAGDESEEDKKDDSSDFIEFKLD